MPVELRNPPAISFFLEPTRAALIIWASQEMSLLFGTNINQDLYQALIFIFDINYGALGHTNTAIIYDSNCGYDYYK